MATQKNGKAKDNSVDLITVFDHWGHIHYLGVCVCMCINVQRGGVRAPLGLLIRKLSNRIQV